jgi:ubiquinone/menaquinone biosynthesis C-methylase UbiE
MAFLSPKQMIDELNIKPGSSVVDLGSGSGAYVYEACRVNKTNSHNGKILAVDIDKDRLDLVRDTARVGGFMVETMVADLDKRLILSDYSADYIILANTLFMLENKSNLIKECSRILTPDGYLLFVEWKEKDSLLGPKIDMKIKKEDAIKMFYENGFEVKKELEAGDYHYAYIFSR